MQELRRISAPTDIQWFREWAKKYGGATDPRFAVERLIRERLCSSPLSTTRYLGAGSDGVVLEDTRLQRVLKFTELPKGVPALFSRVAREALVGAYVNAARLDPRYSAWACFLVGTSAFGVWEPAAHEAEVLRTRPSLRTRYVAGMPPVTMFAPFVELTDLLPQAVATQVRRERLQLAGLMPAAQDNDRAVTQLYIEYTAQRYGHHSTQFAQYAIQEQQLVRGMTLNDLICVENLLDAPGDSATASGGRRLCAILYVVLQMLAQLGAAPQRFVHMDMQLRNIMMQPVTTLANTAYSRLVRPDGKPFADFLQTNLHGAVPVFIDLTTARLTATLDDRAAAQELNDTLRTLLPHESAVHIAGSEDVRRLGLYLVYLIVKHVQRAQRSFASPTVPSAYVEHVPAANHQEYLRSVQRIDARVLHIAMRMISAPSGWFDESTSQRGVPPNWSFLVKSLKEYVDALSCVCGYAQMLYRIVRLQPLSAQEQRIVASLLVSAHIITLLEQLIHDLNPYMAAIFAGNPALVAQEQPWTPVAAVNWPEWRNEWAWYKV